MEAAATAGCASSASAIRRWARWRRARDSSPTSAYKRMFEAQGWEDKFIRLRDKSRNGEWDTMARLYEEVGREDKAVEAFRSATKKSPYELDTHRRLIRLYETIGREEDALRHYEKVIRIAPGEPRFQLELAERYYKRGQRKRALTLLRKPFPASFVR